MTNIRALDRPETRLKREALQILDEARSIIERNGVKAMTVLIVEPNDEIVTKQIGGSLREIVGAHQIAIHQLIATCSVGEDDG